MLLKYLVHVFEKSNSVLYGIRIKTASQGSSSENWAATESRKKQWTSKILLITDVLSLYNSSSEGNVS